MKIFFSGRIPRDTGGSAAESRPANAVRGIKYAICMHNRTPKAGGAHRRASEGTNGQAAIAAVSHQTREDVMKNLFQIEHRIAAVYSLAALHAGGRIFHQRQAAIWAAA